MKELVNRSALYVIPIEPFKKLITYTTTVAIGLPVDNPPKRWRRPKRKPCKGVLEIGFEQPDRIHWLCPVCEDEGVVSGWEGLIWDMTIMPGNYH